MHLEHAPSYDDLGHPNYVYMLSKDFYGLKEAPIEWHDKMAQNLTSIIFCIAKANHFVFVHMIDKGIVVINTSYAYDLIEIWYD